MHLWNECWHCKVLGYGNAVKGVFFGGGIIQSKIPGICRIVKRLQDQQLNRQDASMVCWIITVDILYCVLSEVVVLKTHLSWKTHSRNRARRHSCFIHVLCLRTKWISCCFEHVFSIFGGTNDKTPRDDGILKANNCIRFKQNRLAWENGLLCSLLYYLSNRSVTFSDPYKLACLDLDLHIQVDFLDNIVQVVIQQYCIVESQLNHSWIIELVIHVLRVW